MTDFPAVYLHCNQRIFRGPKYAGITGRTGPGSYRDLLILFMQISNIVL